MIEFPATDLRNYGIGAEQKKKCIRRFDSLLDLIPPIGSRRDIDPVDPRVKTNLLERSIKLFCESFVFARIGDEDFSHTIPAESVTKIWTDAVILEKFNLPVNRDKMFTATYARLAGGNQNQVMRTGRVLYQSPAYSILYGCVMFSILNRLSSTN